MLRARLLNRFLPIRTSRTWIPVMLVLGHNGSSLWLADQIFMPSVTLVFVQAIPTPEPIFDSFDN